MFKVRIGDLETDGHFNLNTALGNALLLLGYKVHYKDMNDSMLVKLLKSHTNETVKVIFVKKLDDKVELFTEIEDV